MTLTTELVVGTGATVGSVSRYQLGRIISSLSKSSFPWGTWLINMAGAFLLGLFFQNLGTLHQDINWWMFLGTGFCGGFTTFSTMSVETVRLIRTNRYLAVLYVLSSLGVGSLLVWVAATFT